MMKRATLALACLALAACDKAAMQEHHRYLEAERAKRDREQVYRTCINEAVGMFAAASVELVKHCENKAKEPSP